MIPALLPADEFDRLNMLQSVDLLDTPPDPVLDELVGCAAAITGCPVALLSLVDSDRQWFKSRTGMALTQTPRDIAFCGYTILGDDLFEVTDAVRDPRFFDNPLVTGPAQVRYYAGVPVSVGGYRLGALCVIDNRARELDARERSALAKLGSAVSSWLEQHCMELADGAASAGGLLRTSAPVEVSSNRHGGFHLSLRAH